MRTADTCWPVRCRWPRRPSPARWAPPGAEPGACRPSSPRSAWSRGQCVLGAAVPQWSCRTAMRSTKTSPSLSGVRMSSWWSTMWFCQFCRKIFDWSFFTFVVNSFYLSKLPYLMTNIDRALEETVKTCNKRRLLIWHMYVRLLSPIYLFYYNHHINFSLRLRFCMVGCHFPPTLIGSRRACQNPFSYNACDVSVSRSLSWKLPLNPFRV